MLSGAIAMRSRNRLKSSFAACAMVLAAASFASSGARAEALSDDWKFHGIIYAYLPDIGGSSDFPAGTGSSVNISADKILSNLKFTFMGTLEAQKGRWGAFTDVLYLDVGGSKSQTRDVSIGGGGLPAGITSDLDLDVKGTVWTLAGSYRFMATPDASADVFAGARLLSVKERLNWKFSGDVGPFVGPGREGSNEQKVDNWDAIVGVKGRLALGAGSPWYVPYYADVGTGDSDLTWQAMAGIGYAFQNWEILGAWRYLDYDLKSGSKINSITFNGPMIGVAFHW
jgi:hypothetical protein